MAQQARRHSKNSAAHYKRGKSRSRAKAAAAGSPPLRLLLFIFALAVLPNILNGFSAAYVRQLKTADIALTAADLPPPRRLPASSGQNRFIALPARLAAGAAAGLAAEDLAALESAGGSRIFGANAGRALAQAESETAGLGKSRPDPANLGPQNGNAPQAAPVFAYKIDKPLFASSTIIMLLHGSGADETSLFPFARSVWPRATLVGLRGRVMQGAERRWYHKFTPTAFNRQEALSEAQALGQFVSALAVKNHYAPKKMIFVGYSNGANLLAVMAMQYPQLIKRAVLLRPMPVLAAMPQNNLHKQQILALSGAQDRLYGGYAEALYADMRQNGAQIISYRIPATHMLNREDKKIITRWLRLGY